MYKEEARKFREKKDFGLVDLHETLHMSQPATKYAE